MSKETSIEDAAEKGTLQHLYVYVKLYEGLPLGIGNMQCPYELPSLKVLTFFIQLLLPSESTWSTQKTGHIDSDVIDQDANMYECHHDL